MSFASATPVVVEVPPFIEARAREVEALRTRAAKQGAAIKASCIDQKLRQIRQALAASRVVVAGWSLAERSPDYRQRSLYRMRVLKIYAVASADAAFACVDAAVSDALARRASQIVRMTITIAAAACTAALIALTSAAVESC